MKSELLHIGPFTLYGYGFMIGLGVLAAWITAGFRARKYDMDPEKVFNLMLCALAGGMGGAKILFWINQWREILADPGFLLDTLTNGFVVYGGIIGGILACQVYCKVIRCRFLEIFDLFMPSVALAQGFGRIGCLLAGCCYGKETSGPFFIVFRDSEFAPNHVHLIPTQICSAILDFLNAIVLMRIADSKKLPTGSIGALYLINYSIGRFLMEFFRGDTVRGAVGMLSTSQFIALFTFTAGCILLGIRIRGNKIKKRIDKWGKKD